jgi:hypothetical protein
MIVVSILSVVIVIAGYVANGHVPFDTPISLLIDDPHPAYYHAILLSVMAVIGVYLLKVAAKRHFASVAFGGIVLVLLLALLFVDNNVPQHDALANTLFFLASIFLFTVTLSFDHHAWKIAVALPLLGTPLVFSDGLKCIAVVEGLILSSALVLSGDVFRATARQHAAGSTVLEWYYNEAAIRADDIGRLTIRDLIRRGSKMKGYLWACLCVLASGLCGVYAEQPVIGVMHFAACWVSGYCSEHVSRYDNGLPVLMAMSGPVPLVIIATTGFSPVANVVFPIFLTTMAVVAVVTVRRVMQAANR